MTNYANCLFGTGCSTTYVGIVVGVGFFTVSTFLNVIFFIGLNESSVFKIVLAIYTNLSTNTSTARYTSCTYCIVVNVFNCAIFFIYA